MSMLDAANDRMADAAQALLDAWDAAGAAEAGEGETLLRIATAMETLRREIR